MRFADFPLLEPIVYVVRAEEATPKQLKPTAEVRVWRDEAGYAWVAQDDELVELERESGGKPFQTAISQRHLVWLLLKQSGRTFHLQTILPSDWAPLDDALEVAVDEKALGLLHREVTELNSAGREHMLRWLQDEFVVDCEKPWFAIQRAQGARAGNWCLLGRSWRLDLEMDRGGKVFVRRLTRLTEKRIDWSMIIAKLQFVDQTVASQLLSSTARSQLEQSVQSYGSYIDLWKKYSEEEWQRSLRQAAELNVLAYSHAEEASDEGGVWRFKVVAGDRDRFEEAWKSIESDGGLELEATEEHPEWRQIQDEVSALAASRRFRGRPEFPRARRDEILISGTRRKLPESGYLSLSLAGDRTVQERRLKARQAIESGRRLPQLRYLLQNLPLPSVRVEHHRALTPHALGCFKHGSPTPSQEKAIYTALNTPDIALIIGPPGTGKTQVIAALERRLAELGEKAIAQHQVLISSFQHDAVENALERTSVYGLPGIKVGQRRDAEGLDLIERWCSETTDRVESELSAYEAEQAHLSLLRRVHASIAKLRHGQFSAEHRMAEMLTLSESLDELAEKQWLRLDALLMDEWREYVSEQPRLSPKAGNKVPLLLRKIRALRVTPLSFMDDGPERLIDLISTSEYLGTIPATLVARLHEFEGHRTLDAQDARRAQELRDDLLDSLLDYRPPVVKSRIDDRGRSLLIAIEAGIEDRLKKSRLGAAGVLARYRDAFQSDPIRIRETVREYAMVVGATCQQAASVHMASLKSLTGVGDAGISFNTVIIDEAARANPLDLFIPMSMAERRIVLVGDHRQLPHLLEPEVEEAVATTHSLTEEQRKAFEESLFQRLWRQLKDSEARDGVRRVVMLDTQFRMHPILGDFVSREFYEREGLDPVQPGRPAEDFLTDVPGHDKKVCCWIDVPLSEGEGKEGKARNTPSRLRILEARRVAEEAKRLLEGCGDTVSIGVITFYSAQRDAIFEALRPLGVTSKNAETGEWEVLDKYRKTRNLEERFRIGTVDAFQGKEFDIVLLSVVRSNRRPLPADYGSEAFEEAANSKYGHLRLSNRMNVAMSRQRSLLIAVGDKSMAEAPGADKAVPALSAFLALCREDHGHIL